MDDANRVPIDIGYEVAAAAEMDQLTVVKDDGTVVIDIRAPLPCAARSSTEPEIVVCAATPDNGSLAPTPFAETQSPMDILADAFSAKIGPVEIVPGLRPARSVGIGVRIRF